MHTAYIIARRTKNNPVLIGEPGELLCTSAFIWIIDVSDSHADIICDMKTMVNQVLERLLLVCYSFCMIVFCQFYSGILFCIRVLILLLHHQTAEGLAQR